MTGAAGGIGRASARAFAKENARVVVVDIDADRGHETIELIGADGGEAHFVRADVASSSDVRAMPGWLHMTLPVFHSMHRSSPVYSCRPEQPNAGHGLVTRHGLVPRAPSPRAQSPSDMSAAPSGCCKPGFITERDETGMFIPLGYEPVSEGSV